MKAKAFFVGGTGESSENDTRKYPAGMLRNVADEMDPLLFEKIWVPYDASIIAPKSMNTSLTGVHGNLMKMISECERNGIQWTAVGYSLGAVAVSNCLIEANVSGRSNLCIGAALVGNPYRHYGFHIGKDPGGYGISGQRGPRDYGDIKVYEAAIKGDPISGASPTSLLRSIADFVPELAVSMPPSEWQRVLEKLNQNKYQFENKNIFEFFTLNRRVQEAKDEIKAYLPKQFWPGGPIVNPKGGRHTDYAVERVPGWQATYTEAVARYLNQAAVA
jgi:hypothetical protein